MLKLPPLNAVRAFEAAARHVSFSKAAEELNVTRGAISRHVSLLEEWLGTELFRRTASQLSLTDVGRNYHHEVKTVLTRLAFASNYLVDQSVPTVLRLNAPPTFTMRWFIVRLSAFQRRLANVDIQVTAFKTPVNLDSGEYDLAIRGGIAPLDCCISRPFLTELVVPVCHPDLVTEGGLRSPNDLRNHTIISFTTESYRWPEWLNNIGLPRLQPQALLKFDPMYFALQAALEGLGVVMVPLFLVIDELVTERLCAPFGMLGARARQYYVSYPHSAPALPLLETVGDWLVKEGNETNELIASWIASMGWDPQAEPAGPRLLAAEDGSRLHTH
ncbi:LysR family transcriptional regulator [Verticiella sediminum]|uniref:LysR family transcriptional regulator n=1 Tax=Verticiella sediminum TaxID=1247510 RepID=A0A556ANR4_9BURK|nr:LysR substrate-binding domain-containing protein [Verticiella sediminum]TSH94528.1 LysR family transcriptional regulator [Verticiella sediminum]